MLPEDQCIMLVFAAAVLALDLMAIRLYRGARP